MEKWLLVRNTRRGDPSSWAGWQWLGRESNDCLIDPIGLVVEKLPLDVVALEACSEGVKIYWQERGGLGDVSVISHQLSSLRKVIRN